MNGKDEAGASVTGKQGPPGPPKVSLPSDPDKVIARSENGVTREEASFLSREIAATVREEAADSREEAAELREGAAQIRESEVNAREGVATTREREIRAAETTQGASNEQLELLQQANSHLVIATLEAQKQAEALEKAKAELDHRAHHDALTDLPNRILLEDRLHQAIEGARRQSGQLAIMFLDLDQFKHINDSLGHAVGDQLLRSVARRLLGCVRGSDTISRPGGDEFLLLLSGIEHAEDAAQSAQKILAALARSHRIDLHDLHIGVSIGISIYPDDGEDAETLIKCADSAMYHAKESGRNTYKFFERSMNVRAVERQSIEGGLRRALDRQEFVLHYQPKINLHSGRIIGVEALIRWQHPERGLLLPAHFIAIAEDCGLILPIDRWVLREVCLQGQAWRQAGLPPIVMAANTSALEFRAPDFLDNIRTTLESTGLEPCYLELELTESVLMRDAEAANSVLHALSELGVQLAVDDFGTGYSSLSYLRRFPVDTLKIDQSFVNQVPTNPDDAAIVRAVIAMAKSLRLRVIAEGVETQAHHDFLLEQDCDEGQGYLYGRPMAADALASLLQTGISPSLPV